MLLLLPLLLLLELGVTHDSGQQIDLIRESKAKAGRACRRTDAGTTTTVDYLVTGATPSNVTTKSMRRLRRHRRRRDACQRGRSLTHSAGRSVGRSVLISVSRPATLLWLTRSDVHHWSRIRRRPLSLRLHRYLVQSAAALTYFVHETLFALFRIRYKWSDKRYIIFFRTNFICLRLAVWHNVVIRCDEYLINQTLVAEYKQTNRRLTNHKADRQVKQSDMLLNTVPHHGDY